MSDPRATPAMQQYARFKQQHPGCVLLFRMGDFYEMFDDDAVRVSKAIGLTLTRRTEGVPMAGVPHHQLETYARKLIGAGFRVAVCDQIGEGPTRAGGPAASRKPIFERAVTRVLTPGTLVEEALIAGDAVGRLVAVAFVDLDSGQRAALACVDASTGAFLLRDVPVAELADEVARAGAAELLYPELADGAVPPPVRAALALPGVSGTARPPWHFRPGESLEVLRAQFGVATLAGFGLRDDDPALGPAGAVLRYMQETQAPGGARLGHLAPPRREDAAGWCTIDAVTLRALEVVRTIREGGVEPGRADRSLLGVLISGGACRTAMGRRLLRDWLVRPSAEGEAIRMRHAIVATFVEDRRLAAELGELLAQAQDAARLGGRVALGRAGPRDVMALARTLALAEPLARLTESVPALAPWRRRVVAHTPALAALARTILARCTDDPPAHVREGNVIRAGIDAELDEARLLQRDAGSWLAGYQAELARAHNLPGLKIGFNQVFGYYIELTAAQARAAGDAVPSAFARKQTLRNAERYTTPELREFEGKVTSAEARALERERVLFQALCAEAAAHALPIAAFADDLACLDVLLAFAARAVRLGWTRPEMVAAPVLEIRDGRHPVLEEVLGRDFVANDLTLGDARAHVIGAQAPSASDVTGTPADIQGVPLEPSPNTHTDVHASATPPAALSPSALHPAELPPAETESPGAPRGSEAEPESSAAALALITGPNMAGKSTFIRQAALIVLLAHAGSFVPAARAVIGLTDRIFARLGADDALHSGQSTFMVEMTETANILHHATPRSLIVLDEIGRGTSTLDGLSLAWAVAERLASPGGCAARTLFATHYHELTRLADQLPDRVKNLHVAVREWPAGDEHAQIVFLHRILPGRTDKSYGLHVARLAGVPAPVITRAREILASLNVEHAPGQFTGAPLAGESDGSHAAASTAPRSGGISPAQMMLFTEYLPHPAVQALLEMKLEALSPLEAFDALRRLKDLTRSS